MKTNGKSGQQRLDVLINLSKSLFAKKGDHKELLRYILDESISLIEADRGTIFLLDADHSAITSCFASGVEEEISLDMGKGIVGDVIKNKSIINIEDAYKDPRFFQEIDKKTGYRTKEIVCVPIQSTEGKMLGAIELLNSKKGGFTSEDESVLLILGLFAAISIESQNSILLLKKENKLLREQLKPKFSEDIIGQSKHIKDIREIITNTAKYNSNVIITGESGTGKEVVARMIHEASEIKGPFIAINCAAIPDTLLEAELFGIIGGVATGVTQRTGKIEQADGGTLFLDELGDMPALTQAKLLRAIAEHKIEQVGGKNPIDVSVRFVAATNKDLKKEIVKGNFREDLFYRLNVVNIHLPPLRERQTDIPFLFSHFLKLFNEQATKNNRKEKKFTTRCIEAMIRYSWPGNIRQLENEIERCIILSGDSEIVTEDHLNDEIRATLSPFSGKDNLTSSNTEEDDYKAVDSDSILTVDMQSKSLHEIVNEIETELLVRTMKETKGNKSKTAEKLGISREGLRKMLSRLSIKEI